jgi:2-dehydro-3-deoxygluconokinase
VATFVCFGEVLLRLAAQSPALLMQEGKLDATFCGAEANVAVGLNGFGHRTRMVSLLPDNRIGDAAKGELARFGVQTDDIKSLPGRMGLYFLTPGAMSRPAEIIYDRADSVFAKLDPAAFDWPGIFAEADWLFVGGITAALGDGALSALRQSMACARKIGVKVAFDCNFRPSLWLGREAEAAGIFLELSRQADLVLAGRRAIGMMLGQSFDHDDPETGFLAAADALFAVSSATQAIAATRRIVETASRHRLTGLLADRQGLAASDTLMLDGIVDRIGTGDAFAAGLLHGLASGMDRRQTVAFATAAAQWCHGVSGDFLRASAADIESLQSGQLDVRR